MKSEQLPDLAEFLGAVVRGKDLVEWESSKDE